MQDDDRQVGSILTRRDALKLLGVTGAALLTGCALGEGEVPPTATNESVASGSPTTQAPATSLPAPSATSAALPACVVRPEMAEGPFFVDEDLNRSDIRPDPSTGAISEGAPLTLTFMVSQVSNGACAPLEGAQVDVWHCDAFGQYSDVSGLGSDTAGQKFLRGYQLTDAGGRAAFLTIYPGWYPGRTVHIHFKVRDGSTGQSREFTSQLFFDDALSDQVFAQAPYAARGQRIVRNDNDGIYSDQLLLNVTPGGAGYEAVFEIGLA